jgi:hypothetical protein
MRIIPAIAILVLAGACASAPLDPMADEVQQGNQIEQTGQTQDEQPAPAPDARRAFHLRRAAR